MEKKEKIPKFMIIKNKKRKKTHLEMQEDGHRQTCEILFKK